MGKKDDKKRVVAAHKLTRQHAGHSGHLCELVRHRKMDQAASLAKNARYICHICGRAAAKAKNLCEAVEI